MKESMPYGTDRYVNHLRNTVQCSEKQAHLHCNRSDFLSHTYTDCSLAIFSNLDDV